ncbi:MAG: response regulator transcription factor [Solirubrobacteraceae bacterium]
MLVADDEEDIVELIRTRLERDGHTVITAANGEDALALARAEMPGVCVLDVMMPKLTGLEVMRALRADPATARMRILMLTARAGEQDVDDGFSGGADDYVTKPFSPQELGSRVRALLAR